MSVSTTRVDDDGSLRTFPTELSGSAGVLARDATEPRAAKMAALPANPPSPRRGRLGDT